MRISTRNFIRLLQSEQIARKETREGKNRFRSAFSITVRAVVIVSALAVIVGTGLRSQILAQEYTLIIPGWVDLA